MKAKVPFSNEPSTPVTDNPVKSALPTRKRMNAQSFGQGEDLSPNDPGFSLQTSGEKKEKSRNQFDKPHLKTIPS